MIGRPRTFDREEALGKAMDVFWAEGYAAASVQDLLDGMGINRGSMYDTFGDKHALFVEAVKLYERQVTQQLVQGLEAPGSAVGAIRRTLAGVAEMVSSGECRGCLLTNTIVELAPHDDVVADAVRSVLGRIEKAFRSALGRAVKLGELSSGANTRGLARFLTSTVQGLVVMGKASVSRASLRDIVSVSLAALR